MSDPLPVPGRDEIAAVLGRIPSGLCILTARGPGERETGMLASWVQQASFDPPAITVAVSKRRYVNDWLTTARHAAVSLIGESQKQFISHFGKGFEPDQPAFTGLEIDRAPNGAPVLSSSLGWLAGEIGDRVDGGDHWIYVLRVGAAGRGAAIETEKPWVHLRRNGLGY